MDYISNKDGGVLNELDFDFENGESLEKYKKLLETDVLTGLNNRYAYTRDMKALSAEESIPSEIAVFSIDINELKSTNDKLGHLAGDELIKGASRCIYSVLGKVGKCYRTGGDEFIAILAVDSSELYRLRVYLMEITASWRGSLVQRLSLSVGYASASDYPDVKSLEKLVGIADEKMYESKAQYYMQNGRNRRKSEVKRDEMIEKQQKEYAEIISAFASDVTGLYVLDRRKREVTAYRISTSDHRILSGVPLKLGFETAMDRFIDKCVHPDDRETMRQSIHQELIERELVGKKSFIVHFRTVINGELNYNYMKCIRNRDDESYDKLIISFCPEDALTGRKRIHETPTGSASQKTKVLLVKNPGADFEGFEQMLSERYRCLVTESASGAMEILREQYAGISTVIYQLNQADMSAENFLNVIFKDVYLSAIPVIVILENEKETSPEDIERCAAAGATDFLFAPYNKHILYNRMDKIIQVRKLYLSLDEIEIDDLTGFYTKQAFLYHAATLLKESPGESFTIVIADIFNFKLYNSVHGTNKGDELIKLLAKSVQSIITNGICARYGADQIIAITKTQKEDIALELCRIQDRVNRGSDENIVLKFGVYENIDRNLEISGMCDRALQALQSSKKSFDHMYASYDGPVSRQQLRAQLYESRFKRAIDNRQFAVWYQPKYNPYTNTIIGAEALVRWITEDGNLLSPAEFLPVFENDGLISQLDEYVFKSVCEYQRARKRRGLPLIPVSVNLSRNSMHHAYIVKRYRAIVEEYEISPTDVPIEITESAAAGNLEIKPLADAFFEAGFALHMDDFGSGNSSIAGLNLLHFDTVKLDRSLIQLIGTEEGNLVLMYTVSLGRELGLHIVAEGVETKSQVEYLKDIGCDGIQGYFYSKPLPENDFDKLLTLNTRRDIKNPSAGYDNGYKLTTADSIVKRAMDKMLQRMPGGFLTYRRDDGRILSSNSYLWLIFGCRSEQEFMEYVGSNFRNMVLPGDIERVESFINRQISQDDLAMDYVEYRIIRKDGSVIPVVDYGHLDRQPDGDIFYVFISPKQ